MKTKPKPPKLTSEMVEHATLRMLVEEFDGYKEYEIKIIIDGLMAAIASLYRIALQAAREKR